MSLAHALAVTAALRLRGVAAVMSLGATMVCKASQDAQPAPNNLHVAWRLIGRSDADASSWVGEPAVAGTEAFFETSTGVVALEATTGRTVWAASLWSPKRPTAFNVVVDSGSVFVNELDSVFAVSRLDGRRLWTRDLGTPVNYHHAMASGGLLITTTDRRKVVALDTASGVTRWEVAPAAAWDSGGIVTGLGASGDTIYVAANEYFIWNGAEKRAVLLALDRGSGQVLWTWRATDRHSSAGPRVAVSGNLLLVGDAYGNSFVAVDRFSVSQRWRVPGAPDSFGPEQPPEVRGDTAFVGSNDRFVYAASISTGEVFWRRLAGGSMGHSALCGPYVLGSMLALAVVPRDPRRPVGIMLSDEDGVDGFPTSGIAVVGETGVFATTRGIVAVRCV